jgi:hypothetical protein
MLMIDDHIPSQRQVLLALLLTVALFPAKVHPVMFAKLTLLISTAPPFTCVTGQWDENAHTSMLVMGINRNNKN